MNKTKVIRNFEFDEISRSYSWEGTRGTFPAHWWLDILMDYLREDKRVGDIEKEYRRTLPSASKTSNSSNNMYISVLLRRFLLNNESKGILKNETYKDAEKAIIDYVNKISEEASKKYKLTKKWKENIEVWQEYIDSIGRGLQDEQRKNIPEFIKKTVDKVKVVKYNFKDRVYSEYSTVKEERNIEEIGKIGEQIAYISLVNEYGIDNVIWTSNFDKYAEYDIEVNDNGVKKYIEVKSSTSAKMSDWFLSRAEYEFYNKNKDKYILYFVKDVFISRDTKRENTASIESYLSPNILIDNKFFGVKDGNFLVTPIKYKGNA